ncbi:MarR family winged helix-turn-helix transcriptional regulator [Planotetraspora sp. GP83]|uniref:MarR family winged helix-turn-helix transcriptional regulator n=1 Tax=Planotetraspora sp. GP83 TaxID=3156264 RepID=UPI003516648E
MTTQSGERGEEDAGQAPLPALLTRAKDITIELLHQRLGEEGLEGIRYRHGSVFRFIDEEGARLTVLADRAGLTKQAIAELVDELERLGYVERATDPKDRRAKIIRLTERGVAGQAAAARILRDIEQQWVLHLGQDRIAMLRRTVEEIIALHSG